jgi:hypothetical protein
MGKDMMKKMRFGGLAAVAALVLAGCGAIDLDPLAENSPAEFTKDGRRLVNLTINAGGNARALTQALAQAAINYYEVVFYDAAGSQYYRVAGFKGQSLKLSVPAATYDNDSSGNKAIVFAGNDSGNGVKTLLAIGKLSTPSNGVIDPSVANVQFTLTALTTDIKAAAGTTFAITTGASTTPYSSVNYEGSTVPCFYVDANISPATAAFTIGGMGADATVAVSGNTHYGDLVISADVVSLTSWGLNSTNNEVPIAVTEVPGSHSPAAAGAAIGQAGTITVGFNTPNETGWSFINLDIPVKALHESDVPNGTLWHIQGGLKNHRIDEGSTVNPKALGGGIVLGIGSPTSIGISTVGP